MRITSSFIVFAVLGVSGAAAQADRFVGSWEGVYENTETTQSLMIEIRSAGETVEVRVRAESEYVANPQFLAARDVQVEGSRISFTLVWGEPVRWSGSVEDGMMEGDIQATHWSGTWEVERVSAP